MTAESEPLEQLKALLPLWENRRANLMDESAAFYFEKAARNLDLPSLIAWAEGSWAGRAAELQRQLAEANAEIARLKGGDAD